MCRAREPMNVRRRSTGDRKASAALRLVSALAVLAAASLVVYAGVRGFGRPVAASAVASPGPEGIPLEINHQGVVSVDGKRFDGPGEFRFALIDPDTDTNLWTNDGSNIGGTAMPLAAVGVDVDKGNYSVRLGAAPMLPIPVTVFDDDNVALRIWFDDGKNGVWPLEPDQVLTSAPYAFRAAYATTAEKLKKDPLPAGVIVMWSGTLANIPEGWALCDGTNGTPNLTAKFIRSVPDASTNPGATGGALTHAHAGGTYSAAGHTHTGTTATADDVRWVDDNSGGTDHWVSGNNHTHSLTISSAAGGSITGTSGEASSLPPYYELAFIMKL